MTVPVAWLDADGRHGLCARCIPGLVAEQPARADLVPVGIEGARGKACVICNQPLAYEPGTAMAVAEGPKLDDYGYLPVDGIEFYDELAERMREADLVELERDGDWAADDDQIERRAA